MKITGLFALWELCDTRHADKPPAGPKSLSEEFQASISNSGRFKTRPFARGTVGFPIGAAHCSNIAAGAHEAFDHPNWNTNTVIGAAFSQRDHAVNMVRRQIIAQGNAQRAIRLARDLDQPSRAACSAGTPSVVWAG